MSLWPLILFHICAGTIALLSGFVAISLRKGSQRHGLAGDVFVISMLGSGASGAIVGLIKFYLTNSQAQLANFFIGTLTSIWWERRGAPRAAEMAKRAFSIGLGCWLRCRLELR
jgi:uncharacterized membrane protein